MSRVRRSHALPGHARHRRARRSATAATVIRPSRLRLMSWLRHALTHVPTQGLESQRAVASLAGT